MQFNLENLVIAGPLLLAWCICLNWRISRTNVHWREKYGEMRHPYSPLFTAIGETGIHLAMLLLIPWYYVAMFYMAHILSGSLMWYLHHRRWWSRNKYLNQQEDDSD